NRTMPQNVELVAEIGLLIYPDCALAAVHGLTDLFRIAADWTGEDKRCVRTSHWQADETGVTCVWDSHPGTAHRLTHVIAPPSIIMLERMASVPAAAAWLRGQHSAGAMLCSICAGAFVLAETGLVDGRRVTTHWAFSRHLAER